MTTTANPQIGVCLALIQAISRTRTVEEIYGTALDALADGLGVTRASILLFDPDGVMRFKAYRGLSETYRQAVEGHSPWQPDSPDPQAIVVADVTADAALGPWLPAVAAEGISAMAFIPLLSPGRVIGKFMLYFDAPRALDPDELQLAGVIASLVAFAVERTRTEEQARLGEVRLRFALDAAAMGTWDWDLATNTVRWSENLARVHGLPPGTFDGTFGSYEREIHPDDRERVLGSVRRAIAEGVPHDVEYRIVAPDGTIRWVEGKGRVQYADGVPVGMTGVCMMVTRRKEAELARLASAEEAGRLKDEFLATLSHELRTPLNAILGWVQMLQSGGVSPDRIRQAIDVVGRNAKLQAQLIEDILDVSRIITDKLEIERLPVVLQQVVETVTTGALPTAEARRIELTAVVPADLPPIEGDPRRLHQVLGNVVSNALKFTPEGGRVQIRGSHDGSFVRIEVQDSGAGIAAEFLPYVFDRFRQADSRSTRAHTGLGLGLAIARHLVEQHRGDIRAESDGEGRGTTVVIRLPVRPAGVTRVPAAASETPEDATGLRLDGATIVVVDDQRDSREMIAALFEDHGALVIPCDSAQAALHVLAAARVDVMVADIAMPAVDGYELLRQVRQLYEGLPALAVSAYARPEDRRRALLAGYSDYCEKPIDAVRVLRAVRQALPASWKGADGTR